MTVKKIIIPFLFLFSCIFCFSACTNNPYKDYVSTGLEVKCIPLPLDYDDENVYKFGYNRIELFTDYERYAVYKFNLNYTEPYFELNDLLVFTVSCCSSDEMKFGEILEYEGKVYPLFYRKKIKDGQPVTTDFIVIPCCAEIPKEAGYEAGEIIYCYI